MQGTKSDLENSMIAIIQVFQKYSGQEDKLRKSDLRDLINNEMSNFIMFGRAHFDVLYQCVECVKLNATGSRRLVEIYVSYHSLAHVAQQKIQDKETLDQLFSEIDLNGDLKIDFQEFIALVAMVTSACHDLFIPGHKN